LDETIARYTQSAPAPAAEAEPAVDTVDAEQS